MTDLITTHDTETIHDFRPSHPRRPAELIEAQIASEYAWKRYDEILEILLYSSEYYAKDGRVDHGRITDALLMAEQAQQWYNDLYDRWQQSLSQAIISTTGA